MICQRCGYCCKKLSVIIIKNPDLPLSENNLMIYNGDENTKCPYLEGNKVGEYSCAVHNKHWFKDTPCAEYQSHWPEKKCRMGEFLLERKIIHKEIL